MTIRIKKWLGNCLKNEKGSSIVEFAVVAPVMFTLLFAGFDFGHTLYMRSVLQGAINKAARDSSLETGTVAQIQAAVDQKVTDQVKGVNNNATLTFNRSYFRTFTDAAFPESEVIVPNSNSNGDAICDDIEQYIDENNTGSFESTGVADGQGYTRDAVKYSAAISYDRLFPLAGLVGWSDQVELTASTVIANQPYGQRAAAITRNCDGS